MADDKSKRSEFEIMRDILECYYDESPENLDGDGEYPASKVARARRSIRARLNRLFRELGRDVDEGDAVDWEMAQLKQGVKQWQ